MIKKTLKRGEVRGEVSIEKQGTVAANTSSSSQGGQGSLKELGGFVGFNVEGSLSTKGKSQNTCDLAYRRGTSCRSHTHVGECGGTHTRSWSERRGRVREGAGQGAQRCPELRLRPGGRGA